MPRLTLIQIFSIFQDHNALPVEELISELSRGRSPGCVLIDLLNMDVRHEAGDGGDDEAGDDGLPSLFVLGISHIEAKVAQDKWNLIGTVLSGINVWLTRCASCPDDTIFNTYLQNIIRDYADSDSDEEDGGDGGYDHAHPFLSNLDLDYLESLRNQMQIVAQSLEHANLTPALLGNVTAQLQLAVQSLNNLRDRLTMLISVQADAVQNGFPSLTNNPALDAHIWSFIMDDETAMDHLTPAQAAPAPANQNHEEEEKKE